MIRPITTFCLAALALGACNQEPEVAAHSRCDAGALMRDITWFFPATVREGRGFNADESVLVGAGEEGEFCVFSTDRPELLSGWVPLDAVTPTPVNAEAPAPWAGDWTGPAGRITLAAEGEALHLKAHLPAAADPALEVITPPQGDFLTFTAESCGVTARKVSTYLILADNGMCAGGGASFSGVYRRAE